MSLRCFGDPKGFCFRVDESPAKKGWGTFVVQLEPGLVLGHDDRLTELEPRASWLAGSCETQLAGWPRELAEARSPEAAFARLNAILYDGTEEASPAVSKRLKAFVLTHALGEPFDGLLAIVRPSPTGLFFVWEDARQPSGATTRSFEVPADAYRAAVDALYREYGSELGAATFRRLWTLR